MSRRILLFIVAALLLIWLTAPAWLTWLVRKQLQQAGFSHVVCEIDQVGWSALHIRHLSAKRNQAQIGIDATQLTVRYHPAELLQQRVSSLHIDRLTVSVHTAATIGTGGGGLIVLSQLALLQQLPFDQATIDHIRLQHFNRQQQRDLDLDGHAVYARNRIDLQLQDPALTQLARLSLERNGAFTLQLQHAQQTVLLMQGTLQSQQQRLYMDSDVHINLARLNAFLMRWGLQLDLQPTGSLDIHARISLPRNQPLTRALLAQLTAEADIRLQASLLDDSAGANITGSLKLAEGRGQWQIQDNTEIHIGRKQERTTLTTRRLGGTFSLVDAHAQLMLQRSSRLDIRRLRQGNWFIPQAGITLNQDLILSTGQANMLLQPVELQINIPSVRHGHDRIALPDIRMQLQRDRTGILHGRLQIPRLSLTMPPHTLRMEQLQAMFRLKQQQLSAQWQAALAPGLSRLEGELALDMQRGSGHMHYHSDSINIGQRQAAVKVWLNNFMPQLDLQQGNIRASGDLRWQGDELLAQAQLQLEALAGSWQQQAFQGLQTTAHLRYDGQRAVLQPARVTLQRLQSPVPLQNMTMQLSGSWPLTGNPLIRIKQFSVQLLGGSARAAEILLRPGRPHNPFNIRLERIDLAAIVALEQQEGLQVQGQLDGTLPLDLTTEGLQLQQGMLHARPPGGIIRYTGSASVRQMAESNMGAGLAMQVLSDFRYQRMDIQADYIPDGTLHLAFKLQGHNPNYENGRPITFNLNVEENVLQLIKSLQLGSNIEKNVRKKLHGE